MLWVAQIPFVSAKVWQISVKLLNDKLIFLLQLLYDVFGDSELRIFFSKWLGLSEQNLWFRQWASTLRIFLTDFQQGANAQLCHCILLPPVSLNNYYYWACIKPRQNQKKPPDKSVQNIGRKYTLFRMESKWKNEKNYLVIDYVHRNDEYNNFVSF